MRRALAWTVASMLAVASTGQTQESKPPTHVLLTDADLTWGEAPPAMPKGQTFAVLSGDPSKPGPYTIRGKVPPGYRIPPHWHPTDEHVTVLSGTVSFGMGEKIVPADMKDLPAGGYALMPATMRHYMIAKTAATLQVHGTGPFALTYVNPADDPRTAVPVK